MATHKILIADDSVTIQRLVDQTFADEDVEVVTAVDGEDAIARIRSDRPDVILADIVMPRRSGYEVAAFVKNQPDLAHIPVLLLAGAFEPVDQARAQQMGCDGVLVKPFKPQQLIARVRELLKGVKGRGSAPQGAAAEALWPLARPAAGDPALMRPVATDPSLDDYFGRLDAALTPGPLQIRRVVEGQDQLEDEPADDLELPTLEAVLAGDELRLPGRRTHEQERVGRGPEAPAQPAEPPVHIIHPSPAAAHQAPPPALMAASADRSEAGRSARSVVTDAFSALLAVELGEPGAAPVRLGSVDGGAGVTDSMIEDVTQRVLERLTSDADDAVRDVVARIVSEVAERLVRDEIRRIREGRK